LGSGGKQSLKTVLDGAVCDCDRQMGFATAGFAFSLLPGVAEFSE
jgi:hypothetical protein